MLKFKNLRLVKFVKLGIEPESLSLLKSISLMCTKFETPEGIDPDSVFPVRYKFSKLGELSIVVGIGPDI